jgi:hypothetical protein
MQATAFSSDGRCLAAGCQDGFVRTIRIDAEDRNLALCMAQQPRLGCGRDGSGGSPLALLDGDLLRLVVSLIPATTLRLGGVRGLNIINSNPNIKQHTIKATPDQTH